MDNIDDSIDKNLSYQQLWYRAILIKIKFRNG